jgi:hypothetical protein
MTFVITTFGIMTLGIITHDIMTCHMRGQTKSQSEPKQAKKAIGRASLTSVPDYITLSHP